ncbi:MAG TPA: phosphate ABC transporter permease subunit PstC [Polyangiaceae bacterium]|jgi:phosphate transport system permease protein|nr:phosphate ABC transporter permease subunit PstC [Polyangiaceae bacterium]
MADSTIKAPPGPDLSEAFRSPVSRPPTAWQKGFDVVFRNMAHAFGILVVVLLAGIVLEVMRHAGPAMASYGLRFLTTSTWDANRADFGILPEILGTLYTSILALLIGGFLGVTVALVLSQGFVPRRVELVLKNVIELLAAIPSVVYGLWGIFVLVPAVRGPSGWLNEHFGFVPFFSTRLSGPGILPASLVLSIMILPTVTAISREAMAAVPKKLASAAYGLGATRWEVIFRVILPTSVGGIFGALVLGFGRALGETMALAMLVGNANVFGLSLFSPGNTLAALLANHFPEAGKIEVGALMYAAVVLMLITLTVNALGSLIMLRATRELKGLG